MRISARWSSDGRYAWPAVLVAAVALGAAIPALGLEANIGRAAHESLALDPAIRSWGVDWTPRALGVAATQALALATLAKLVGAAGIAAVAIAALTLWALYATRGEAKRGEWTLHRAVGASRRMLLGAGVRDGATVAAAALALGATGGLLATWVVRRTWPGTPSWVAGMFDGTVLAALILMALWIVLLAVAPFLALRRDASLANPPVARRGLVVPGVQLGVTLAVLLAAARLVGPSHGKLASGERHGGLVYRIAADDRTSDERAALYGTLLDTLADDQSVGRVAVANPGMFVGAGPTDLAITDCGTCWQGGLPAPFQPVAARYHLVSPDTFAAAGIRLVAGRAVRRNENATEPVAIVSRALAERHFERDGAVGRRIRVGRSPGEWHVVIGVAEDREPDGPGLSESRYAVYLSALQHPAAEMELLVSAQADGSAVRRAVAGVLGPEAIVGEPAALEALRQVALRPVRWLAATLGITGVVTLLLASYGVAVVSGLTAGRRRAEYALRRAVGARAWEIRRLAYWNTGRSVLLGIAIGGWLDIMTAGFVTSVMGAGAVLTTPVVIGLATVLVASAFVGASRHARHAATVEPSAGIGPGLY